MSNLSLSTFEGTTISGQDMYELPATTEGPCLEEAQEVLQHLKKNGTGGRSPVDDEKIGSIYYNPSDKYYYSYDNAPKSPLEEALFFSLLCCPGAFCLCFVGVQWLGNRRLQEYYERTRRHRAFQS